MTPTFDIAPLSPEHDRADFSCGVEALDRYLKTQASQDVRRRVANCFVASPVETALVAGYYTLAAASIPVPDLPEAARSGVAATGKQKALTRRLPRYPVLPAALIGRLAVDSAWRGRKLGAALLFDAIQRSVRAEPAVFAILVDAKDTDAASFYRHFGFTPFTGRPLRLYLPAATALKAIGDR